MHGTVDKHCSAWEHSCWVQSTINANIIEPDEFRLGWRWWEDTTSAHWTPGHSWREWAGRQTPLQKIVSLVQSSVQAVKVGTCGPSQDLTVSEALVALSARPKRITNQQIRSLRCFSCHRLRHGNKCGLHVTIIYARPACVGLSCISWVTSECHWCHWEGNGAKTNKQTLWRFFFSFLLCIKRMQRSSPPPKPPLSSESTFSPVMRDITWPRVSAESVALSPREADAVRLMFWMCERHRVWIGQNHRLAPILSSASLIR